MILGGFWRVGQKAEEEVVVVVEVVANGACTASVQGRIRADSVARAPTPAFKDNWLRAAIEAGSCGWGK